MATTPANLPSDGVILRNLKASMFKMSVEPLNSKVTCMTSAGDYVFVAVANGGCLVYKVMPNGMFAKVNHLAHQESKNKKDAEKAPGASLFDLAVGKDNLVYIKEESGSWDLCVHKLTEVLDGSDGFMNALNLARKAPLVLVEEFGLLAIGGAAWSKSWTVSESEESESNECMLHVLQLDNFTPSRQWKVAENSISMLRHQVTDSHNMVGVADSRTGLKVFDFRQPTENAYECLYQVPVEEIRNFQLIGNFVGVFHKFEPNVSFWNMKEQKTILCINIQDQMKELAEEFLEEEDEDLGMYEGNDDHVTSVTSVPSDDDNILIYGTKSGCLFGMSVNNRSKLFNISCPHEPPDASSVRMDISGLCFLPKGKVAVAYEKYGLTLLDFSPENPPDRPPTRHQKRDT